MKLTSVIISLGTACFLMWGSPAKSECKPGQSQADCNSPNIGKTPCPTLKWNDVQMEGSGDVKDGGINYYTLTKCTCKLTNYRLGAIDVCPMVNLKYGGDPMERCVYTNEKAAQFANGKYTKTKEKPATAFSQAYDACRNACKAYEPALTEGKTVTCKN